MHLDYGWRPLWLIIYCIVEWLAVIVAMSKFPRAPPIPVHRVICCEDKHNVRAGSRGKEEVDAYK